METLSELEPWQDDDRKRVLVLSSTPRREGNSQCLADAVCQGASAADHQVRSIRICDHVSGFLRDCRSCRRADGRCSINDGHARIFHDLFLPADAVVYASPIYWYGLSGHLKVFFDRMFCYIVGAYPNSHAVVSRISGKRAALVLSAEESNLSARLGITTQLTELCRYLHHDLVGVVVGIGNTRGEVADDPGNPLESARSLGRTLFNMQSTDYQIDVVRSNRVWGETDKFLPAQWR